MSEEKKKDCCVCMNNHFSEEQENNFDLSSQKKINNIYITVKIVGHTVE